MTQDFKEKLSLIVADKLVFAAVLLVAGWMVNAQLETFKSELTHRHSVTEERRATVAKQLSEFYYPLYLRLEKDTVIWKQFPNPNDRRIGSTLETQVLRPNRQAMLKLLEDKGYLAEGDDEFFEARRRFILHVAISEALHELGDERVPQQIAAEYEWPYSFQLQVERRLRLLQAEHKKLATDINF